MKYFSISLFVFYLSMGCTSAPKMKLAPVSATPCTNTARTSSSFMLNINTLSPTIYKDAFKEDVVSFLVQDDSKGVLFLKTTNPNTKGEGFKPFKLQIKGREKIEMQLKTIKANPEILMADPLSPLLFTFYNKEGHLLLENRDFHFANWYTKKGFKLELPNKTDLKGDLCISYRAQDNEVYFIVIPLEIMVT